VAGSPFDQHEPPGGVCGLDRSQLQNRSGGSVDQLAAQVRQFLAEAAKRPELGRLSTTFEPGTPQVSVELDREKARTLGVKVDSVYETLQAYLSGLYVNDIWYRATSITMSTLRSAWSC
jgi:multidrug efflux pump subunit AcrB